VRNKEDYIQSVSGGTVNILGGGSMDYKYVSSFQWVWRYRCLNVMHKTHYKRYEGRTNDLLIAFIGYVNGVRLKQFKVFKNTTFDFNV
jgi:hypothetical protein